MRFKNSIGIAVLLSAFLGSCSKDSSTPATQSGNWVKRSEFEGVARAEAVSFVANDKAYIATGFDGTKRLKDLWQYDADLNFWTQKADFAGAARNSAVAFAIADKGYIGTGYDGVNNLKDFWEYSTTANQWTRKSDFSGSARYDAVGFGIATTGYISTGFDGNYLKDMWSYNPSTDSWNQEVSMGGEKRSGAVAFVNNNKAYITTGNNNGTNVNDLWEYDPSTKTWAEKRKISNASTDTYDDAYAIIRTNGAAFVMNGKAYITSGSNGAYLADTWEYDFTNDVWVQKSNYEGTARDGAISFAVKNRGYVATGKNSTYYFDDIFELHPDETLNTND